MYYSYPKTSVGVYLFLQGVLNLFPCPVSGLCFLYPCIVGAVPPSTRMEAPQASPDSSSEECTVLEALPGKGTALICSQHKGKVRCSFFSAHIHINRHAIWLHRWVKYISKAVNSPRAYAFCPRKTSVPWSQLVLL